MNTNSFTSAPPPSVACESGADETFHDPAHHENRQSALDPACRLRPGDQGPEAVPIRHDRDPATAQDHATAVPVYLLQGPVRSESPGREAVSPLRSRVAVTLYLEPAGPGPPSLPTKGHLTMATCANALTRDQLNQRLSGQTHYLL